MEENKTSEQKLELPILLEKDWENFLNFLNKDEKPLFIIHLIDEWEVESEKLTNETVDEKTSISEFVKSHSDISDQALELIRKDSGASSEDQKEKGVNPKEIIEKRIVEFYNK